MKTFDSPLKFANHLLTLLAAEEKAIKEGLKKSCKVIEKTAKNEFGVYQPEVGPFQEWAELADSTKNDRLRNGFTENDPLLRTGELRDSISYEVGKLEAVVGSDSDIMVYHEFGTSKMPARPVLGPAAYRNKKKIQAILGFAMVTGLIGGEKIHEALRYDFEV